MLFSPPLRHIFFSPGKNTGAFLSLLPGAETVRKRLILPRPGIAVRILSGKIPYPFRSSAIPLSGCILSPVRNSSSLVPFPACYSLTSIRSTGPIVLTTVIFSGPIGKLIPTIISFHLLGYITIILLIAISVPSYIQTLRLSQTKY